MFQKSLKLFCARAAEHVGI